MRTSLVVVLVGVSIALGGRLAAAGVVLVDPAGAPGAPILQAALDAAQSGDILLLRSGDYSGAIPTASGKTLTILADAGEEVVLPGLRLANVPLSGTAVVRGLRLQPAPSLDQAVDLTAGSGRAWIEDCAVIGVGPSSGLGPRPALHLTGNVSFVVRCHLVGARGEDAGVGPGGETLFATPGGAGLACEAVNAVIFDTSAVGGRGGDGPGQAPVFPKGGAGAALTVSNTSTLQGGTLVGGDEGIDDQPATKSGPGLSLFFGGPVSLRDVHLQAGAVNGAGIPAAPLEAVFSQVTTYAETARTVAISSPVRELQDATITVHALPADSVLLRVSMTADAQTLPGKQGTNILGSPAGVTVVPLGVVSDPSGTLVTHLPMPRLPPGTDGLVLFTQLGVVSAQGVPTLGTGSALVWLSAAL